MNLIILLCFINTIILLLLLVLSIRKYNILQANYLQNNKTLKSIYEMVNAQQGSNEIKFLQLFSLLASSNSSFNPGTNAWILKSNDDTEKTFTPGKIILVKNEQANAEIRYEYSENMITSTSFKDGKLTSSIKYNSYGSPIEGCSYDEKGTVKDKFTYNELGQVEKVQRG